MDRKIVLIILFVGVLNLTNLIAQQTSQSRCKTQPEYRQFDFWIGEWEVKNPNEVLVGSSKVELVVGDCLILENWTSSSGSDGKSMNYYNMFDQKWHQKWIGSEGIPIEFVGEYNAERKSMDYTGKSIGQNGEQLDYKFTFFHLNDDHVRQLWEQTTDGGASWATIFDGHYYRIK